MKFTQEHYGELAKRIESGHEAIFSLSEPVNEQTEQTESVATAEVDPSDASRATYGGRLLKRLINNAPSIKVDLKKPFRIETRWGLNSGPINGRDTRKRLQISGEAKAEAFSDRIEPSQMFFLLELEDIESGRKSRHPLMHFNSEATAKDSLSTGFSRNGQPLELDSPEYKFIADALAEIAEIEGVTLGV